MWLVLMSSIALSAVACAKVGSQYWCQNLEEKPKGDQAVNKAKDYAKLIVL